MSSSLTIKKTVFNTIKRDLAKNDLCLQSWEVNNEFATIDVKKLSVFDALRLKDILRSESVDHSMIKIELFILGGGMKGFASAVIVGILDYLNWGQLFSQIWASSAGVPSALYLADGAMSSQRGKTFLGATIYPKVLARNDFIKILRIFTGNIVDIELLEQTFRKGKYSLSQKNVSKFPVNINALVSESETLDGRFIKLNAKSKKEDMIDWTIASSSIPGATIPKEIQGKLWLDGDLNSLFEAYLKKVPHMNCTHVLVLPNQVNFNGSDIYRSNQIIELISELVLLCKLPLQRNLRKKWSERIKSGNHHWRTFQQICNRSNIPVEIIWSPKDVSLSNLSDEFEIMHFGKKMEEKTATYFHLKSQLPWELP